MLCTHVVVVVVVLDRSLISAQCSLPSADLSQLNVCRLKLKLSIDE